MSNNVLVDGFFINDNKQEWIEYDLVFNAQKMAQLLIDHKDVIEANKGNARISLCRSKNDKLYASFSTYKPTAKPEVTAGAHMPDREDNSDLPF
jgi:hypothetical protein